MSVFCILFLLLSAPWVKLAMDSPPIGTPCRVVEVMDGDTLRVVTPGGRGYKIRVWGIDAPEKRQPMGQEARGALSAMALGRTVTPRCFARSFDRWVCSVGVGGKDVGGMMTSWGWAFQEPRFARGAYGHQEAFARRWGLGVWQLPDGGQRPWEWRTKKGAANRP